MNGFVLVNSAGESFSLSTSATAGRHIDNDIVLAGEDVRDFHFRLQPSERELRLILLPNAVVDVNGAAVDDEMSLIVNDVLILGQETFHVRYNADVFEHMDAWALRAFESHVMRNIDSEVVVGRDPAADLVLAESHVSRRHARLFVVDGVLWIEDLRSANGTTINGARVARGGRLFHGDEIGFDQVAFQVTAQGADLTPVQRGPARFQGEPVSVPLLDEAEPIRVDTEEVSAIDFAPAQPDITREAGCYLVGLLDQSGRRDSLQVGSYVVGRSSECDIVIDHPSVSDRHAELSVSVEGCYVSDLMSTNGLWVNGSAAQASQLRDGDRLSFGTQQFQYQRSEAAVIEQSRPRLLEYAIGGGLLLALALLLVFL